MQKNKQLVTKKNEIDYKDFVVDDVQAQQEKKQRYKILTASNFFAKQDPINWIVDGLVSAGSVNVFFGEPGCGKTWALLDLAICAANGTPWLDMATIPGPVLIVDEESGERRLSSRMGEVLRGHDAGIKTPIMAVSLAAFDVGNKEDYVELYNLIINTKARLVIIDALADIMPGRDENAVKDTQPIFISLRKIAEETQAAIIVIHHNNKKGDYRGSSAIKGAIDLLLSVEKKNDSNNMMFKTEKARDTLARTFSATMNFDSGKFWLTTSEYEKTTAEYNKGCRYVFRYLTTNKTATMSDIQGAVDSCSEEAARKAVYYLVNILLVERVDPGGRGTTAIFSLTKEGTKEAQNVA